MNRYQHLTLEVGFESIAFFYSRGHVINTFKTVFKDNGILIWPDYIIQGNTMHGVRQRQDSTFR